MVSFKNVANELCMEFNGEDQIVQNRCDYSNSKMKFHLESTATGSLFIKSTLEICLYTECDDFIRGKRCQEQNRRYQWALIPALV